MRDRWSGAYKELLSMNNNITIRIASSMEELATSLILILIRFYNETLMVVEDERVDLVERCGAVA